MDLLASRTTGCNVESLCDHCRHLTYQGVHRKDSWLKPGTGHVAGRLSTRAKKRRMPSSVPANCFQLPSGHLFLLIAPNLLEDLSRTQTAQRQPGCQLRGVVRAQHPVARLEVLGHRIAVEPQKTSKESVHGIIPIKSNECLITKKFSGK